MMNHWVTGAGHYGYWGPGFNIGSVLFNILFWGAVIVIIVILFSHFADHSNHEAKDEETETNDSKYLDIVKERYAKGEINKKEYEQLKKDFE